MSDDSDSTPILRRAKNGKAVGEVSEAMVLARLVELGYAVSLPFGDNQRYDMVVDNGRDLIRAQVKTGRLRDGRVVFESSATDRGYAGEADDFLVYCAELGEIYRVPVLECGESMRVALRVHERNNRAGAPTVRWARDYVLTVDADLDGNAPLPACERVHPGRPPRMCKRNNRRYCKECNLEYCRRGRARQRPASA